MYPPFDFWSIRSWLDAYDRLSFFVLLSALLSNAAARQLVRSGECGMFAEVFAGQWAGERHRTDITKMSPAFNVPTCLVICGRSQRLGSAEAAKRNGRAVWLAQRLTTRAQPALRPGAPSRTSSAPGRRSPGRRPRRRPSRACWGVPSTASTSRNPRASVTSGNLPRLAMAAPSGQWKPRRAYFPPNRSVRGLERAAC